MINVNLGERTYQIIVGRRILASVGARCAALGLGSDVVCVTSAFVRKRYGPAIAASFARAGTGCAFFAVPDGEKSKSFEECRRLLQRLARFDHRKRPFLAAVGGGVVGDLTGFCAAVFKRGIPYIQVPTTLLAQVDSSIGGKTAIDLAEGKNLVGAFYQPRLVVSDVCVLESLDRRQFATGMAEAVKYGIIGDPSLFSMIERGARSFVPGRHPGLLSVVKTCSRIKARVVELDERDVKGVRMVLNFGHTIGHALETAAGYGRYTHGEAVAIGMACACDLSVRMGLLDPVISARVERTLVSLGLPVTMQRIPLRTLTGPYFRDKKFQGKSRFVLLRKIGSPQIVDDVPLDLVKEVVTKRMA